jgi:hypothetical protein
MDMAKLQSIRDNESSNSDERGYYNMGIGKGILSVNI